MVEINRKWLRKKDNVLVSNTNAKHTKIWNSISSLVIACTIQSLAGLVKSITDPHKKKKNGLYTKPLC